MLILLNEKFSSLNNLKVCSKFVKGVEVGCISSILIFEHTHADSSALLQHP